MAELIPLRRPDPDPVRAFAAALAARDPKTVENYSRAVRGWLAWIAERPGGQPLRWELLTETSVRGYLEHLAALGRAPRTRALALAAIRRFCRWAQAEGRIGRNPASEVAAPVVAEGAPKELSEDQRYVLRSLVERSGDPRIAAIFALGYWAGLRAGEVARLSIEDVSINQRAGVLVVRDDKGGKTRTIPLANEARRALLAWLESGLRDPDSAYVFPSRRAASRRARGLPDHLGRHAVEAVWRQVRRLARHDEWPLVQDVRFHDLRHDFAHRARAAGWPLEAIAVYLGHQTRDGAPAISTTARYTLPSREQLRALVRRL